MRDGDESVPVLYTATARNRTGASGETSAGGGLRVRVRPPIPATDAGDVADVPDGEPATNPEELLALAWATCLGASARVVAGADRCIDVRVEVDLVDDPDGPGFAFVPTAVLWVDGATADEAEALAAAAHERCPMSKLLSGRGRAIVRTEPYAHG